MIIVDDIKQRSPEWFKLRCGLPSASHFKEIITPLTRKPSASAYGYACRLIFERLTGEPYKQDTSTAFMDRGTSMEAEARYWYEFERDVNVRQVAAVLTDDRSVICSPDGLVGDDGLIEIETPGGQQHIAFLLKPERLVADKFCQAQGGMWICERQWCDIISYNPRVPSLIRRQERDKEFIEQLAACVASVTEQVEQGTAKLREQMRYKGDE